MASRALRFRLRSANKQFRNLGSIPRSRIARARYATDLTAQAEMDPYVERPVHFWTILGHGSSWRLSACPAGASSEVDGLQGAPPCMGSGPSVRALEGTRPVKLLLSPLERMSEWHTTGDTQYGVASRRHIFVARCGGPTLNHATLEFRHRIDNGLSRTVTRGGTSADRRSARARGCSEFHATRFSLCAVCLSFVCRSSLPLCAVRVFRCVPFDSFSVCRGVAKSPAPSFLHGISHAMDRA